MKSQIFTKKAHFALPIITACLAIGLTPSLAPAAANEDSLVCAKVKDSYAVEGYKAAFWPRSSLYGDMTWCQMKVKAVERCVPVETVLHSTTAPYDAERGPELHREYTCYPGSAAPTARGTPSWATRL